jgi:uncharacterized membrane protein YagU involved in acid resistance
METQTSVVRGILAGMAGGLVAAWVLNEILSRPGQTLQPAHSSEPQENATMKADGPAVPYGFGALTGGLYGGLAEYSSKVTSGFGTSFGGVLFSTADLLALPVLNLGPSLSDQPASATPFAAHIVYGATTEFVRRLLRLLL